MPVKMALTAVGRDRPGIVAGVSRVLFEHGCNLEDSSMTILEGEFAMILIVAVPDAARVERLRADLDAVATELNLVLNLRDLPEPPPGNPPEPARPCILTVYGADQPGIVYRVTRLLADRAVNVTDVKTRVVDAGRPVYIMQLEVELPPGLEEAGLEGSLRSLGGELQVDVTLRALETAHL